MSSARFKRMVYDAALNNDTNAIRDAYYEWQSSNCYHPLRQLVYDAHTQTQRFVNIPCGRCYHCLESKINEWCTRMYAHAEDFKRVYFVTLTYRSITNPELPTNKLLLSKLCGALWHRDAKNSTHHYSYNPCVLVKSHYQNFLKRLRKNTGINDLTYVLSGEYGHEFGRPHFHMILFSNSEITREDIVRAWSVCLWKDHNNNWSFRTSQKKNGIAYDFPIGRVDFHDLVSNGTFNTTCKVRVDGTYMNASQCFSYVCKYVCKREDANMNRVYLAYNSMFKKKEFIRHYTDEIPADIAARYLRDIGYNYTIEDIYNLKKLSYEKIIYEPDSSLFSNSLSLTQNKTIFGKSVSFEIYPKINYEFRDLFSPFCEFSRGVPIGSIYAKRNISEFAEGVFTKPLLQVDGFVVPSYFRRKASEYLYGLRVCKQTFSGKHYAFGGLVNLLGRFTESLSSGVPPIEHQSSKDPRFSFESSLSDYSKHFADLRSGERVVLCDGLAQHFKYNRSQRSYVHTKDVPLSDWLCAWCVSLQNELHRHEADLSVADQNNAMKDDALLLIHELLDDAPFMNENFVNNQNEYLSNKQKIYHSIHKNID